MHYGNEMIERFLKSCLLQIANLDFANHGEAKLKSYTSLLRVLLTKEVQSLQENAVMVTDTPRSQVRLNLSPSSLRYMQGTEN